MLKNEENRPLIEEIEAGIKKEVSVGCRVENRLCSICGQAVCNHIPGRKYDGHLCFTKLCGGADAYEWSFVPVPAQRAAGVTKFYNRKENEKMTLRQFIEKYAGESERAGCFTQLEELEKSAQTGRIFRTALEKEVTALANLTLPEISKEFTLMIEKTETENLLALKEKLEKQKAKAFTGRTQLSTPEQSHSSTTGEFMI